ncbi:MAG: hypothetical protein ACRC2H_00510 [Silanimonas sp.]
MKPLVCAAISLTILAGTASASTTVSPVEAEIDPLLPTSLDVPCTSPELRDADVHALLGPHAGARTFALRNGLLRAVHDACEQDIASIIVKRRGMRVDWTPAIDGEGDLALR